MIYLLDLGIIFIFFSYTVIWSMDSASPYKTYLKTYAKVCEQQVCMYYASFPSFSFIWHMRGKGMHARKPSGQRFAALPRCQSREPHLDVELSVMQCSLQLQETSFESS